MAKPVIGILGAGKLGTTLARLGDQAGYDVLIANSKPVKESAWIINAVAHNARVVDTAGVLAGADTIILALPLSKYDRLESNALDDKLVLDAMNYWWEVDGTINHVSSIHKSSSEVIQDYFKGAKIVKAFNHMGYHDLEIEADRNLRVKKVIAFATDHPEVRAEAANIISQFGFEPYDLGELRHGQILEPGSPLFGADLPLDEFTAMVKTLPDTKLGQRIIEARGAL